MTRSWPADVRRSIIGALAAAVTSLPFALGYAQVASSSRAAGIVGIAILTAGFVSALSVNAVVERYLRAARRAAEPCAGDVQTLAVAEYYTAQLPTMAVASVVIFCSLPQPTGTVGRISAPTPARSSKLSTHVAAAAN